MVLALDVASTEMYNEAQKINENGKEYFIKVNKENSWLTLENGTGRKSYVNAKNALVKGWLNLPEGKYYFDYSRTVAHPKWNTQIINDTEDLKA